MSYHSLLKMICLLVFATQLSASNLGYDQCDTTNECKARYGSRATDCVDSTSNRSWCSCSGAQCTSTSRPPSSSPSVMWYADPNKSFTSSFYSLSKQDENDCSTGKPSQESTVSTFVDGYRGKSWRVFKAQHRKRAELSRTGSLKFQEGRTYFIGWRMKISASPNLNGGITVMQWKSEGDHTQNYPFHFGYDGNYLTLDAYTPKSSPSSGTSQSSRRATIWHTRMSENSWQSIVVKVHASRNENNGHIELWHNGVRQKLSCNDVASNARCRLNNPYQLRHRTLDGSNVYTKWGAYNSTSCGSAVTVDLNNMRVAATYEGANP